MDSINYYEKFSPEAGKTVGTLFESVTVLTKQVANGRKRLADEQNKVQRLEDHKKKLNADAAESLSSDEPKEYEKYQTALKSNGDEIERRSAAVRQLSEVILPEKQKALDLAKLNLKNMLNAFMLRSRGVADTKINELIAACITERQDFLDAFTRIFADFGVALIVSDESYCPGIWRSDEVRDLRVQLGMDGTLAEAQRVEAINIEQMATVKPHEDAVAFPVAGQPQDESKK